MQEEIDKKLDALMKKVAKNVTVKSPSSDFTEKIMNRIAQEDKVVYKPLITKQAWFAISITLFGILILGFGFIDDTNNWFNQLDYSKYFTINLPKLELSKTVIFSICLAGFLILAQVTYLKYWFDKRLS